MKILLILLILIPVICLVISQFIGMCVYREEFLAWKIVMKNFDKVKFYEKSYSTYKFVLLSKEGDDVVATIELYESMDMFLIDEINYKFYIQPEPYFLFCHRFVNDLINLLPSEYQTKFTKETQNKSFKDYL